MIGARPGCYHQPAPAGNGRRFPAGRWRAKPPSVNLPPGVGTEEAARLLPPRRRRTRPPSPRARGRGRPEPCEGGAARAAGPRASPPASSRARESEVTEPPAPPRPELSPRARFSPGAPAGPARPCLPALPRPRRAARRVKSASPSPAPSPRDRATLRVCACVHVCALPGVRARVCACARGAGGGRARRGKLRRSLARSRRPLETRAAQRPRARDGWPGSTNGGRPGRACLRPGVFLAPRLPAPPRPARAQDSGRRGRGRGTEVSDPFRGSIRAACRTSGMFGVGTSRPVHIGFLEKL